MNRLNTIGVLAAGVFAAASAEAQFGGAGRQCGWTGATATGGVSAAAVVGDKRTLTIVVDFNNAAVECSVAEMRGKLFTDAMSVDRYTRESSYGAVSWSGDVVRVSINFSATTGSCNTGTWQGAADAAARAQGFEPNNYVQRNYVAPRTTTGCPYAFASGNVVWTFHCRDFNALAHEMGHSLGMHHASTDTNNDGALEDEYGDLTDVMGHGTYHHNAPHKIQMGWIPGTRWTTISANGTYQLSPLELSPGSAPFQLAYRIVPPSGFAYFLSYRRPIGWDAGTIPAYESSPRGPMGPPFSEGVNVHRHNTTGVQTRYIRTMADNQTYTIPGTAIQILQVNHDANGVTFAVSGFPGTVPTPTPTATPTIISPTPTPTPTSTPTPPTGSPNLALNKPATGTTPCNANETAAKAVNGSVSGGNSDKWCSSAATKWLQVDLGGALSVGRFVVKHAAAGGESASFNTRDFDLQTSTDLSTWTTAVSVTANTASTTTHTIAARTARYVRLNVTLAQQTSNAAARIYELEVYAPSGSPTPTPTPPSGGNLALGKAATGTTSCNANETPAKAVNGSVSGGNSDKWCSLVAEKWLQVDLGAIVPVRTFVVKHAGAGGESATFNTRDFNIQTSTDAAAFTTVVDVAGSTAGTSTHAITARTARYVRLNVTAAEQSGGGAARIYELEVYP